MSDSDSDFRQQAAPLGTRDVNACAQPKPAAARKDKTAAIQKIVVDVTLDDDDDIVCQVGCQAPGLLLCTPLHAAGRVKRAQKPCVDG